MKISKISVTGLFDRFNHDIAFSEDDPVTIIIGPNGFGKTMILRTINVLFNSTLQSLERLPFEEVKVLFDDDSILKITRHSHTKSPNKYHSSHHLEVEYSKQTEIIGRINSEDTRVSEEDLPFSVDAIENMIPVLDQIGPYQWRNLNSGQLLELDDVMADFGEQLPSTIGSSDSTLAWFDELRQSITVRFIGIERLTHWPTVESRPPWMRHTYFSDQSQRTVRHYSDNLASMIQQKLAEYGTLSQSLDRTFPVRLMEAPTATALTTHDVMDKLKEVEQKRSSIVEAGLLGQEEEALSDTAIESVDESSRSVLAVYVQDALQKLSIFDELYARVNSFKRIANARFLYKQVTVNTDGLKVTALDGSELDLEMLSSGEQHELVLLFDLLFGTAENSLVMIDEPELSLHVAWQDEFLNDLLGMAELSDYRVLLATHSPQVIGDRWDLTVELKGPKD